MARHVVLNNEDPNVRRGRDLATLLVTHFLTREGSDPVLDEALEELVDNAPDETLAAVVTRLAEWSATAILASPEAEGQEPTALLAAIALTFRLRDGIH